jgi:hypothetical protein
MIVLSSRLFLRDEIDFARRLNFGFYHLTCLRFNAELFLFVWFFLRSFLSSFSYSSFIDCRFDHCEIIISHYFFLLTITMRWSWDDRRRERRNCWKEKHRLSCVALRVRLWIEKEWESRKLWEQKSNFELRKVSEWWFWNNQKKEEHFFEDVNSMY